MLSVIVQSKRCFAMQFPDYGPFLRAQLRNDLDLAALEFATPLSQQTASAFGFAVDLDACEVPA